MFISVLMPVFNEEKYLAEAINSVIRQTYQQFELIIVDDGSTDSTFEIIKYFASISDKIIAKKQTENKGKNSALNVGFNLSNGDLIILLAGDDVLKPNALEKRAEFSKKSEATYCNYDICDKDMNFLFRGIDKIKTFEWEIDKYNILYHNIIGGGLISLKRSIANKIFPINEKLPFEDWWISFFALYYSKRISGIKETLLKYRIHSGNAVSISDVIKNSFSEDVYLKKVMTRELIFYEVLEDTIFKNNFDDLKFLINPMRIAYKQKKRVVNSKIPFPSPRFLLYFGFKKYFRLILISKNKSHLVKRIFRGSNYAK